MVSQELCHLLAIFLDCSSSPCRSLLISKPTLCKTILSSSFVLESCTNTDALFFLFGGIHFQNPGKNSEYYTCRPRFLSNCMISSVQQRYGSTAFWKAKILNSAKMLNLLFWKAKVSKSAKILNSGI